MTTERNYNTQNGNPYYRVAELVIKYGKDGKPVIHYVERLAIVTASGAVEYLDGDGVSVPLNLDVLPDTVPCVHPATDVAIPGMFATKQQLLLDITAFIRAHQKYLDALLASATQTGG